MLAAERQSGRAAVRAWTRRSQSERRDGDHAGPCDHLHSQPRRLVPPRTAVVETRVDLPPWRDNRVVAGTPGEDEVRTPADRRTRRDSDVFDSPGRHAAAPTVFDIAGERLRRLLGRAFATTCAIGLIAAAAVLLWDEITLDLHHVTTTAQVTGVDDVYQRGPASLEVRFTAGGKPVTTTVGQGFPHHLPGVGDQIRIEYAPSDPGHARRAGVHDLLELLAVFGVPFGSAALYRRFRPVRR